MNKKLQKEHYARITDKKAQGIYEKLCAACEGRPGGINDADQMLIADVAYMEQVKGVLMDDILARGVGQERSNGRQRYYQDNKSLAHYRAFCESQRKLLAELRLTPAGRKTISVEVDDDFDKFE